MKRRNPRERYRIEFKLRALAALDANAGKIYTTAIQLGIPKSTLRLWRAQRFEIEAGFEQQRRQRNILLEDRLEVMIDEIAEKMQEKIEKTTLIESIRGVKLLIEMRESLATKRQAEEEASTSLDETLLKLMKRFDAPKELIEQGEREIQERQLASEDQ
ncbi:MAG: hypothetical protein ABI700_17925 [Chloroflexota bacterium]